MPGKKDKDKRPSAAGRKVATSMRAIDGSELKPAVEASASSSVPTSDEQSNTHIVEQQEDKAAEQPAAPVPTSASGSPSKPRPKAKGKVKVSKEAAPASSSASASESSKDGSTNEAPGASGSRIAHSSKSSKTGTPRATGTSRKKAVEGRISRRFIVIAATLIVVLVVATGVLAWNQWFRYDDAADLQGTWTVQGTDVAITITDTDMVMTSEVSYPYTMDTFAKTIQFSFQDYSGSGSYAFSSDRTTFVITEKDADTGEEVYTTLVKQ